MGRREQKREWAGDWQLDPFILKLDRMTILSNFAHAKSMRASQEWTQRGNLKQEAVSGKW